MVKLTDHAGETSGNVPRPRSDFGNKYAYNGLRTSTYVFMAVWRGGCHLKTICCTSRVRFPLDEYLLRRKVM
ncbi:unnamed protein product [Protopolystoma xenopodis]|uniref:Uncharacterized protein n=1 Tax=Protopolystoma xenopodis TaxID=117903 RepID=A0A448XS82_9PLAT|nr:unnamed protein product [Protopolystoma xenopodis]